MSKVFRHVITGLVSILLDAIILKSRLLAQSRGGSAREKGRGRREGGGCELRSRLHRAADSRRRLLRYQYYRGRGESLEAAAPECSCTATGPSPQPAPPPAVSQLPHTTAMALLCAHTGGESRSSSTFPSPRAPLSGRQGQGREEGDESLRCPDPSYGKGAEAGGK